MSQAVHLDPGNSSIAESLLQHRSFVMFWWSRLGSTMAYQMQAVVVGWQIYALTGRVLALGLVGLAEFLAILLLTLPAGYFADQRDRRVVIAWCQLVSATATAVLAVGSLAGWLGLYSMLVVVFVGGASRAIEAPAMAAVMSGTVPETLLTRAISRSATAYQISSIAGPLAGGLVYLAGASVAYASCTVTMLLACASILRIGSGRTTIQRSAASYATAFAGLRFIWGERVVFSLLSLDLVAVLLGGATALLPVYAGRILHVGPGGQGLLRAAPALGALVMSAILARTAIRRAGYAMAGAVAVFGTATIIFALSHSLLLSIAALGILGAADVVNVVIRSSVLQLRTPEQMRGRVSAASALFIGGSNQLGEFESGFAAALIGAVPAVALGGIATVGLAFLWLALFPELRKLDSLHER